MGFIKWLYGQYKAYKVEQDLSPLKPNEEEKYKTFLINYARCVELGFSEEAIRALMNLWISM